MRNNVSVLITLYYTILFIHIFVIDHTQYLQYGDRMSHNIRMYSSKISTLVSYMYYSWYCIILFMRIVGIGYIYCYMLVYECQRYRDSYIPNNMYINAQSHPDACIVDHVVWNIRMHVYKL